MIITSGAHSVPEFGWAEPRFVRFREAGVMLYGVLSSTVVLIRN